MDDITRRTLAFIAQPKTLPVGDNTLFAQLAAEKSVIRTTGVWIVARHSLVAALAAHPDTTVALPPGSATSHRDSPVMRAVSTLLPVLPAPDHRRLRRILAGAFGARAAEAARPSVEGIIDELLTGPRNAGGCEVVSEICGRLPVYTTCALLGLPRADWDTVMNWAGRVNRLIVELMSGLARGPHAPSEDLDDICRYIEDLVDARLRVPGDDIVSTMAAMVDDDRSQLSRDELVSAVLMLFMTGIDTVGGALANVVLTLADHSRSWDRVVANPGLARAAYLEGLRLLPPLPLMSRIASADITIGEITVPRGTTLLLLYGAANLDHRVFADPTAFDLDRTMSAHMTFGRGAHHCLGAALALVQGETFLRRLAEIAPRFAIDGTVGPRRPEVAFHTPTHLRLRFDPARTVSA
ncbi:MAG: cytochrome P450 [Rhodococcus sp. (in: high G+C Gram-positive bacteria)]